VQNSDVRTLLTCLDDVTTGDVSQEDVDPALYKALQLAQYGSQYLLSCRKVMKDRETVLKTALKTFQEEEELLDLKLAKMRYAQRPTCPVFLYPVTILNAVYFGSVCMCRAERAIRRCGGRRGTSTSSLWSTPRRCGT
jgi:hypothetical protein